MAQTGLGDPRELLGAQRGVPPKRLPPEEGGTLRHGAAVVCVIDQVGGGVLGGDADLDGQPRQPLILCSAEVSAEVVGTAIDIDRGTLAADLVIRLEDYRAVAGAF